MQTATQQHVIWTDLEVADTLKCYCTIKEAPMISGNMFDTFPLLYQPLNSQSTIGNILKSEIKKLCTRQRKSNLHYGYIFNLTSVFCACINVCGRLIANIRVNGA